MFDRKFVFHIISEIIVILGVVIFFFNEKRRLEKKVSDLENKVTSIMTRVISLENKLLNNVHVITRNHNEVPFSIQQQSINTSDTKYVNEDYNNIVQFEEILSPKQNTCSLETIEEINEEENIDSELVEEFAELEENK